MQPHIGWDQLGLNQLGFSFRVEEREDGTPWVKVVDPWYNRTGVRTPGIITLRLQPYASYTEAREIANFINSRLFAGRTPILALQEAC